MLFFILGLTFAKTLILTPKPLSSIIDLESFNIEHNIHQLATFDDITFYKTDSDQYKNTLGNFYDIEDEQIYSVNSIKRFLINSYKDMHGYFVSNETIPWHLDRINKKHLPLNGKYTYSYKGSCHKNHNVNIETVVVDTGCDVNHQEFEGRAEFLENFTGDNQPFDGHSHGTFTSSQIGGLKVGVCKDSVIKCIKVLDNEGRGSTSGVIAGLEYAFKRHTKNGKNNPKLRTILSMSLGGGYSKSMNTAIEKMIKTSDTFYIVVASGNENSDACRTSPASAKGVLTVNAMDKNDKRAYFSNFGPCTDIYSPGVLNYGAVLDNKYAVESGTSFSAPILAGVMNHFLDMYPDLNMKQLKEKILSDATKDTIEGNPKNTPNRMVYLNRDTKSYGIS